MRILTVYTEASFLSANGEHSSDEKVELERESDVLALVISETRADGG